VPLALRDRRALVAARYELVESHQGFARDLQGPGQPDAVDPAALADEIGVRRCVHPSTIGGDLRRVGGVLGRIRWGSRRRAEPLLQRLDEAVERNQFGLFGANEPAQAPHPGKVAGLLMVGKHRGVSAQFFLNLGTLVVEQPPEVVGLPAIGAAPVWG
jgi:hypothetical protein